MGLDQVLRIGALEDGTEEHVIVEILGAPGGLEIRFALRGRDDRHRIVDDADGQLRCLGADRLDAQAMGEIGIVGGMERRLHVPLARRVDAQQMRQDHRAPGLVEGRDRIEPVAETADHGLGIALEGVGGRAGGPAAIAHQRQWQVPMIERRESLDAALLAAVDQAIVEIQSLLVERSGAIGIDARPGDRETIGFDAQFLDQVEIVVEAIVMVAGDIAIVPVVDTARHVGEGIPDRGLATIGLRSAFDLEGGGGDAEDEIARKAGCELLRIHAELSRSVVGEIELHGPA